MYWYLYPNRNRRWCFWRSLLEPQLIYLEQWWRCGNLKGCLWQYCLALSWRVSRGI